MERCSYHTTYGVLLQGIKTTSQIDRITSSHFSSVAETLWLLQRCQCFEKLAISLAQYVTYKCRHQTSLGQDKHWVDSIPRNSRGRFLVSSFSPKLVHNSHPCSDGRTSPRKIFYRKDPLRAPHRAGVGPAGSLTAVYLWVKGSIFRADSNIRYRRWLIRWSPCC